MYFAWVRKKIVSNQRIRYYDYQYLIPFAIVNNNFAYQRLYIHRRVLYNKFCQKSVSWLACCFTMLTDYLNFHFYSLLLTFTGASFIIVHKSINYYNSNSHCDIILLMSFRYYVQIYEIICKFNT